MSENPYDYWQRALAMTGGRRAVTRDEMKELGVHDDQPGAGYFRKRTSRAGPFVPVALWQGDDGIWSALVAGHNASAQEIWTYCCAHPIHEEWYHARMRGEPWPDEDAAVTESLAHDLQNTAEDPLAALKDQIASALAGLSAYAKIDDDATAGKAQSLRSRLLDLSNEADKDRTKLVRPHLDAEKAINAQYMPLVKEAKGGADTIRAAISAHETRKDNALKAAEAIRLKAEQKAEADRLAAIEAGKPAPPAPEPPPPAPAPVPQTKIAGAYGRSASIKTIKIGSVTDQDTFYNAIKATPDIMSFLAAQAQKFATAGIQMPGMAITEEKRVS